MITLDGERARLRRRGLWLEYASMAWMVVEAGVAIAAGIAAASIALVAFGLDSVIELFSAAIVVWQLRGEGEDRETNAVGLIGVTSVALAAYLTAQSIHDLISEARPEQSPAGIGVTAAAACWSCRAWPSPSAAPATPWTTKLSLPTPPRPLSAPLPPLPP
jgi:divalent metal cation (Fe/Co/Zn/Cd) transporter